MIYTYLDDVIESTPTKDENTVSVSIERQSRLHVGMRSER
jgi:hypothetical protein